MVKISKWWYIKLFITCFQSIGEAAFKFSSLTNIVRRKWVFQPSGKLLFSLFIGNQYSTPNVVLQSMCVQNKWETAF